MERAKILHTDFEIDERFARGWYCFGPEKDYTDEPEAMEYFGTKLVVYRGDSGDIQVLDGYCPHMGADLSLGYVEGDDIRCPFHSWKWGSDGVCNHIPYAKKIPAKACIKAWPTLIKNGLLFVWYDHEENPPIPEQEIPAIDDYKSDEWSDWIFQKMTIHTHPRELIDNMADCGHFFSVHHSPASSFKNIVEGHTYTQHMTANSILVPDMQLTSRATYHGPSYMETYMSTVYPDQDEPVVKRLLVTHIPVDENSFDIRFGMLIKRNPDWKPEDEQQELEMSAKFTQVGFFQDVDVWHTKTRVDNPILCDGDGPLNILRKWHKQFYTDIAKVGDQFKQRKEYDVSVPAEPDPAIAQHLRDHSNILQYFEENYQSKKVRG